MCIQTIYYTHHEYPDKGSVFSMHSADSEKMCVVTYTTIDNVVRHHTVTKPDFPFQTDSKTLVRNCMEYLKTGKWPKEPFAKTVGVVTWGLNPHHFRKTELRSKRMDFPFESSFFYYSYILQSGILKALTAECVRNQDLADALLTEAALRAQAKDEAEANILFVSPSIPRKASYETALSHAKNRIRYHRNKNGEEPGKNQDLCRVIEEFSLYTILEIGFPE